MKLLLLDVYNNKLEMVEANGLEDYYKYLNCRCIDIVRRKIGDTEVEIIIDDEGALIDNPKPSAVDVTGAIALFGNLLIAGGEVAGDGELTEPTQAEVDDIMECVAEVTTSFYEEPYKILVEVDY